MVPLEMLLVIFSRLPVKSLKRFQCACKSWYNHIRSPNFVARHLQFNTSKKNDSADEALLVCRCIYNTRAVFEILLLYLNETTGDVSFHNLDLSHCFIEDRFRYLRGQCNGIYCLEICFMGTASYALLNVALREFKVVPNQSVVSIPPGIRLDEAVGFGYDSKTNDYKIVLIHDHWNTKQNILAARHVIVYSLSSNSWRKAIGDANFPNRLYNDLLTIDSYIHGNYHWRATDDCDKGQVIISFDMVDEVFRKIRLPNNIVDTSNEVFCVGAYEEFLCVVVYPTDLEESRPLNEKYFDIWVMQDYDKDESWIKLCRFGPIVFVERPVCFRRNGQLVLEDKDERVVLYSPSTQKITMLMRRSEFSLSMFNYMESLVSVIGDERNDENFLFDIVLADEPMP